MLILYYVPILPNAGRYKKILLKKLWHRAPCIVKNHLALIVYNTFDSDLSVIIKELVKRKHRAKSGLKNKNK